MRILTHSVVGQLILGALIKFFAPSYWNVEQYVVWSSLSVIGLFLTVGLQVQWKKFSGDFALCGKLVALTTILPLIIYYILAVSFGLEQIEALTVSVVLITTGTGVTIQTLSNLGRLHTRPGQFLTLVSAMDDIPATLMMAWMLFDSPKSMEAPALNWYFLAGAVALFVAAVILRKRLEFNKNAVFGVMFLIFAILLSKFMEAFHLSPVMGGLISGFFLALCFGTLASDSETTISKILKPVLPFYMIYIGMKLTPSILSDLWTIWFSITLTLVSIVTKYFFTYILIRHRKDLNPKVISWGMVPRGIPGFAFASIAVSGGLITQATFTILILIVSVTTWVGLLGLEINLRSVES